MITIHGKDIHDHTYEYLTAREVVLFTASFYMHAPRPKIEDRVKDALERAGLTAKANLSVRRLSDDERSRIRTALTFIGG